MFSSQFSFFPCRRSVQENLQHYRNEKNRYLNQSTPNKMIVTSEFYDPNQNKYHHKLDGNILATPQSISSSATNINHAANNPQLHSYQYHHHHQQFQHMNDRYNNGGTNNNNNNNTTNGNMNGLSSAVLHPALLNIMNEAQGMKFRGLSSVDFVCIFVLNSVILFVIHFCFFFPLKIALFRTFSKSHVISTSNRTTHQARDVVNLWPLNPASECQSKLVLDGGNWSEWRKFLRMF